MGLITYLRSSVVNPEVCLRGYPFPFPLESPGPMTTKGKECMVVKVGNLEMDDGRTTSLSVAVLFFVYRFLFCSYLPSFLFVLLFRFFFFTSFDTVP